MNLKNIISIFILSACTVSIFSIDASAFTDKSLQNQINTYKSAEGKWHKEDGQWYFVEDGVRVKGWLQEKGEWYYLDREGSMKTDWIRYKDNWYYLNQEGVMQTGWILDDGKYYYLKEDGSMAHDEYVDGYYVGEDGSWN